MCAALYKQEDYSQDNNSTARNMYKGMQVNNDALYCKTIM